MEDRLTARSRQGAKRDWARRGFALVAIVAVTVVVVAGQQQSEHLAQIRQRAEQGNRDAQVSLAAAYADGEGVPQDEVEAIAWYRRAAEQEHAVAQYILGEAYARGWVVPQDEVEAVAWYRRAADQGEVMAQYNLGAAYYHGLGVLKDEVEAVAWFRRAAEQGDAAAQFALGVPRRTGQIRPLVDTANPAIFGVPRRGLSSTSWGRVRARMSGPWCASCAART